MSFGFSVGDFVMVLSLAKKIRRDFIDAPAQFKAISEEVRALSIVVQDMEIEFSGKEPTSHERANLREITDSCCNVLAETERIIDNYRDLESSPDRKHHVMKRTWKRLKWEPEDIRNLRGRISSNIAILNAFNGRITQSNIAKLVQRQDDQQTQTVLDWLTSVNYATQQQDIIRLRQPGTGQWLLESPEFQSWIAIPKQTLFCPGIPGAGKTTLVSIIIDNLDTAHGNDPNIGLAYIYFNFRRSNEQRLEDVLASLLKQLAQGQPSLPDPVKLLYDRLYDRRISPSFSELSKTLQTVIGQYMKVFIIVDALDEYQSADRSHERLLCEIFTIQTQFNVSFLATSRSIPEITTIFEGMPSLEIQASRHDVQRYLQDNIGRLPGFVSQNKELQEEIVQDITDAVDGMFLLAKLHLNSLIGKWSAKAIRKALKSFPTGSRAYHSAYQDAMERIQGQVPDQKDMAYKVLSWICCARRQLTALELQYALAVEIGEPSLDEENLPQVEDMVSDCAGLVVIDEQSNIIRLVHYTAQEYFEKTWIHWFPSADQYLATISLTYLNYKQFSTGPAENWEEYKQRLQANCLYEYAARYWGYHARKAYPEAKDLTAQFLQCGPRLASAVQVLLTENLPFEIPKVSEGVTGLHIAAYFGINEEVSQFLSGISCPDVADSLGQTALHWAVRNNQIQMTEFLLHKGLNVNATDAQTKSALHYAASQDNCTLIRLLLKYDAWIEARDIDGQTPLLAAADRVRIGSVKELLSLGAMINALDINNRNALHLAIIASVADSTSLTEFLLSHGIDSSLCDLGNMTPLHYAVGTGSYQIADLLLQAGVDINMGIERKYWTETTESVRPVYGEQIKDAVGLTPLHFAACIGHNAMAEYLLKEGANPNVRCHNGDTPLHIALRRGLNESRRRGKSEFANVLPDDDEWTNCRWRVDLSADYISEGEEAREIYQYIEEQRLSVINTLLASTGLDVNIKNAELDSPLHTVKYDSYSSDIIVGKLLTAGADIFARNAKGQTVLHLACESGASSIACTFFEKGCPISVLDSHGLNALHYAVRANKYETVRVILDRDEQQARHLCLEVDERGRTLMHHHIDAFICSVPMFPVLLSHGAKINEVDHDGNTPLSLYLRKFTLADRTEVCLFLLQNGAEALWTDSEGQTLAHLAMCTHRAELGVLEALSAHGVDLAAKDNNGKSILHHGAIHGSLSQEILNFVRKNSLLDLNDRDMAGKTPLLYASEAAEKKHYIVAGDGWEHALEDLYRSAQVDRFAQVTRILVRELYM